MDPDDPGSRLWAKLETCAERVLRSHERPVSRRHRAIMRRMGLPPVTRRRALGVIASGSAALLGCGAAPEAVATDTAATVTPKVPIACDAPTFAALIDALIEAPASGAFDVAAVRLRAGLPPATLLAATLHAGVRTLSPSMNAANHAALVVSSVQLLGDAVPAPLRLCAVLWALDNFKSDQGAQGPANPLMPALDPSKLPQSVSAAQALCVEGLDAFDAERADLGAAALYRLGSPAAATDLLLRYAARDYGEEHRPICVGQMLRALEVFGWGCGEPLVRFVACVLSEGQPSGAGVATFGSSRAMADTVSIHGARREVGLAIELLVASRTLSPAAMRDRVAAALNEGVHPDTVWDGLLAASAELLLRGNGGGGLHCFDALNAMRWGASRAGSDGLRALLLLQAGAAVSFAREWAASWKYPPPFRALDLDRLEPGTAPKDIESLFERGGRGRASVDDPTPAHDAMAWFAAGGNPAAYMARGRELIVRKGARDAHFWKFPVAVFDEVARIDPFWVPRLLSVELFLNPSPQHHVDWPHLEQALSLAAELGLT